MTENLQALAQLADRCGVATEYRDIHDARHVTSEHTQRALLAAMHIPLDADPAVVLREMDESGWRRTLPPVVVVRVGEVPTVPLSLALPDLQAGRAHRWVLTAEDDTKLTGEFLPDTIRQLGKERFGGMEFQRGELELPLLTKPGYYRLEVEQPGRESLPQAAMTLIVTPPACYQPGAVSGENRVWGPAVQLYSLRSRRNWGIGDFSDLRTLVDLTADAGGGVVGVNPLHALFLDNPRRTSPYSPSSRGFVNILYLDVEAVMEFSECQAACQLVASEPFQSRLTRLRASEEVDYEAVAAAKREVLSLLYQHFCSHHLSNDTDRARGFYLFREAGGDSLECHARFEALQQHFRRDTPDVWGWPAWPEDYRHPAAAAVAAFAVEHAEEVAFFAWLQWLADQQLAAVGHQSWCRGLGLGLYQEMTLGVSPGGSESWTWQDVFATGAYAGAPPDDFSPLGQDWGLPPFIPHRLREAAYAPFIAMLRTNMRHSGALRIDHVMSLTRLFWVPAGLSADQGGYIAYPLEDLLGILALESHLNQCMVIGEDLGTVPKDLRPRLATAGVLSSRLFLFERTKEGDFKPPADYPRQTLVAASTHDLPTLRGFWTGHDLDTRAQLQLFPSAGQQDRLGIERAQDRIHILMALQQEGLLPDGAGIDPASVPDITPAFVAAIHTFLARSKAQILMVQPEDILGIIEQTNLPSSRDDQHPNWRRRLPLNLEDWRTESHFARVYEALRRERGSSVEPHTVEPPSRLAIIPRATYRLQFNRGFTFTQATALAAYLAELGVSHCYASSYLKARPGSRHGYDIVDHAALNPEIGTAEDYEDFVAALKSHGLGQILDVVPNHMGVMGADNAWWLDVLENGPASEKSMYFDIDWEPLNPDLRGKVLLPLLGDHYGTALNRGELRLDYDAAQGEFSVFYFQHRLPIDPATYPRIVGHRIERLAVTLGETQARYVDLQTLLTAFGHLPDRTNAAPLQMAARQRDKEVHKRQLSALCAGCQGIADHIASNLAEFNGNADNARSFDLLHELIQFQGYRLAYWRVASDEINYRRFFDINDLAGLRMEEPAVFEATHRFVFDLLTQGKIDGLRIDHPDGLYDPGQYFRRLQQAIGGKALTPGEPLSLYLVIEKILADHERLPDDWQIHGATGYRFANLVNNLFVNSDAEPQMTSIYHEFTGTDDTFDVLAYEAKTHIMRVALASELNVLANRLARIAAATRDTCDFTLGGLREALLEITASFPVYRSYVANGRLSSDDRRSITWAVAIARKRSPGADTSIYDFLQDVLTTDIARGRSASFRERVQSFAMKFQQFSSPVMAKGVEDTAFYRYHRLSSLNDVGGDPRRFGISVAAFHASTSDRATHWPHNMLATSTHDSKRSEDVRARLNVISEIPEKWHAMLQRWSRLNRSRKHDVDGVEAPSRNDEVLLYQTLIGTWPFVMPDEAGQIEYRTRIEAYMIKALREGKEHSSWITVNTEYETAMSSFIQAVLAPGEKNLFLADFVPLVQLIAHFGLLNSLAQTLIKVTSPGVPDIYQGCELWQFNLVDPDNRRPVDFARRQKLLAEVKALIAAPPEQWPQRLQPLLADMSDGRIKLYILWQSLALRERWPEVFRDGDYLPLAVHGSGAAHVCAFARRYGDRTLIALVPRLTVGLLSELPLLPLGPEVWGDTAIELPGKLADCQWTNVFTGEVHTAASSLAVGRLLLCFPEALLTSDTSVCRNQMMRN